MKLTKEDYMRLPKERLAELLVELANEPVAITKSNPIQLPMGTDYCFWCGGSCKHSGDCLTCPYKEPKARLANNTSIDTSNEQPYHP